MEMNKNIENQIANFPTDLQGVAKKLIKAIDDKRPKPVIKNIINDEIRSIIAEEV